VAKRTDHPARLAITKEGNIFITNQQRPTLWGRWLGEIAMKSISIVLFSFIMLGSYALTVLPVSAAPFAYVTNAMSNDVSVIDTLNYTVGGLSDPGRALSYWGGHHPGREAGLRGK
jgi:DNA-binding beta-propeller fold protein YncE